MEYRDFLPTVLLLTLMAPPPGAAASVTEADAPPAARPALTEQASAVRRGPTAARGRRRGRAGVEARIAPGDVSEAGEYLRCRADRREPDAPLRQAWERFYPACDGAIRRFAGTFRSRGVDVDDCAQEVWADLMKSLPGFRMDATRGQFTSWLYSIVRSKAADLVRRRSRGAGGSLSLSAAAPPLAAADDGPARQAERKSEREALGRALAVLRAKVPERHYQVLHLRQIEGRGVREVAGALGIKPAQVWVCEHRMKRRLREILTEPGRLRLPRAESGRPAKA